MKFEITIYVGREILNTTRKGSGSWFLNLASMFLFLYLCYKPILVKLNWEWEEILHVRVTHKDNSI